MNLDKKTKIVATIGPASEDRKTLDEMAEAGLNVIRLNFSHGDFDEHRKKVERWREISEEKSKDLGVMQDLAGPEVRTGEVEGEVVLKEGEEVILTSEEKVGDKNEIFVDHPLHKELEVGDQIFLDDGKVELKVEKVRNEDLVASVVAGGSITSRRGVNVPGVDLGLPSLTEKDKEDLKFGADMDVDFVALSFVRKPQDVENLRSLLEEKNIDAHIISKIETQQAVDNMEEIVGVSDGIMVARGDLAIEIGPENVPIVQKSLVKECNREGKPVVVATQMLESMIEESVPTRAEVSDVANAIMDGADAVMLSGETTTGDNPVKTVKVMADIAKRVEEDFVSGLKSGDISHKSVVDSVTSSAVSTARDVDAELIVALTVSGFTARQISRFRPEVPVIAFSPSEKTSNQLSISFGCFPVSVEFFESFEGVVEAVRNFCLGEGLVEEGDRIVISAGVPFSNRKERAETNMVLVEEI